MKSLLRIGNCASRKHSGNSHGRESPDCYANTQAPQRLTAHVQKRSCRTGKVFVVFRKRDCTGCSSDTSTNNGTGFACRVSGIINEYNTNRRDQSGRRSIRRPSEGASRRAPKFVTQLSPICLRVFHVDPAQVILQSIAIRRRAPC